MKAIFLHRDRVIVDATTDYDVVILDAVDEYQELTRNPNLITQLKAVQKWGKPVLLRIVSNAQWYCDLVKSMTDEAGWIETMKKYTIKDASAMLGLTRTNGLNVHGLIITAWKDKTVNTTSAWVKLVMQHLSDQTEVWELPTWMEFPIELDAIQKWDAGQLQVYRGNLGEFAERPSLDPSMNSAEIVLPDNAMSYFPDIQEPDVPPIIPEDDDECQYPDLEDALFNALEDNTAAVKENTVWLKAMYKMYVKIYGLPK